jgi:tripartite ATP-independent transporter DctP family solute receptor
MKKVALVLLALAITFSFTDVSRAAKILRIGHLQTNDHPHALGVEKFAELVKQKTDGSIEVKVFGNSQLGNAMTQISSVKMGTLEAFIDGAGWFGQLVGDYYIFSTPYLMKAPVLDYTIAVAKSDIGKEINQKLLDQQGIRMISLTWLRLPRQALSRKPLNNVADFQKIKMRVPELTSFLEGWRALGASPTPVNFSEIYLALQQGVIDACELDVNMIYTQKLYEVAKYLTLTYHQAEPCAMIMNEQFFKGLTPKEQKAIMEAAEEAAVVNDTAIRDSEKMIFQKMKDGGVTMIEIDQNACREKVKDLPYQLEAKGLWTKGLYDRVTKVTLK